MPTAKFACRGEVVMRIVPYATGRAQTTDGTLLRVDFERGSGWVATHHGQSMRVIRQARGSQEEVHRVAARWARGQEKP